MRSEATSPAQYLRDLPEDRRATVAAVRDVVLGHLPEGVEEAMRWGMLSYEVPLERSGPTYNGQPLSVAGLASQARHVSLYLMGIYADASLRDEFDRRWDATGLRLDAGKSCVRFRTLDDLPLDVVGWAVGAVDADAMIALHAKVHGRAHGAGRRKR